MKKTDRKNKTNLVVTWPTNLFSIEELNNANSDFVNITLRVRLKKAIDNGQVGEVGYLHNGKGRPRVVLACTPITEQHIIEAKNRGCLIKDGLNINVVKIDNKVVETTPVVVENVSTENVTA